MPKEWYQVKPNIIKDDDSLEDIETKEFNQSILVDKKPYFFNYVYPDMMKDYKKYIDSANRKALFQFNLSINQLLQREVSGELSEEEEAFLYYYKLQLPNNCNPCLMNKICWRIEQEFDGWVGKQNKSVEFDYEILKTNKLYSQSAYKSIKDLYDLYVNIIERSKTLHKKYKRKSNEEHNVEMLKIKENFKNEALSMCSNEEDLCNMMLDFCYGSGKSKKFVWDLFGEQIVRNLLVKTNGIFNIPIQDEFGDIDFKGLKFKEVQKQLELESAI